MPTKWHARQKPLPLWERAFDRETTFQSWLVTSRRNRRSHKMARTAESHHLWERASDRETAFRSWPGTSRRNRRSHKNGTHFRKPPPPVGAGARPRNHVSILARHIAAESPLPQKQQARQIPQPGRAREAVESWQNACLKVVCPGGDICFLQTCKRLLVACWGSGQSCPRIKHKK